MNFEGSVAGKVGTMPDAGDFKRKCPNEGQEGRPAVGQPSTTQEIDYEHLDYEHPDPGRPG